MAKSGQESRFSFDEVSTHTPHCLNRRFQLSLSQPSFLMTHIGLSGPPESPHAAKDFERF